MGFPITIKRVVDENRAVLFDTCVLIRATLEGKSGPLTDNILAIPIQKRFVTELVMWEFFCGADAAPVTRVSRREWFKDKRLQLHRQPANYMDTMRSMTGIEGARGSGVDGHLAAYSVSLGGMLAIATDNLQDFCWHPVIPLVEEFISPANTTPPDCR